MDAKKEVLVLGAGVSGLSTAILLLKEGYSVAIWAKDLPPNTMSNIAAAYWFPYLANPKDKATIWGKFTLEYVKTEFVNDPNSGCKIQQGMELFAEKTEDPWWKDAADNFRRPMPDELPEGYKDAYIFNSVLMDTSIYIDYLVKLFKDLGGELIQKTIENIEQAFSEFEIVVNCTGLGSRKLFNDNSIYPVRGQVVRVKPNGFNKVIADNEGPNGLCYIIPRVNDIILGGTHQANDWNLEVNPKDTEDILRKAATIYPEFKNVEVIEVKVGLRPARPEIRLEIEKFDNKTVIHNYGHGGSGFTLSWGCAQEVATLLSSL